MRSVISVLTIFSFAAVSCVSTGKYKAMQQEAQKYDTLYTWSMRTLKTCQDANADLTKQKTALQNEVKNTNLLMTATNENNSQLRKQLQILSSLSSAQAESLKKSLDNIGSKDLYLMQLQKTIASRDSSNLAVLLELKATLGKLDSSDAVIRIEKGMVVATVSDKQLFNADSLTTIPGDKSKGILSRLGRVINDHSDVNIVVESYTDSLTDLSDSLTDSWELSMRRSVALVRALQKQYHVAPDRITAAGRGEFLPVTGNDTPEGRLANRRTRILFVPQQEQLLQVIERGINGQALRHEQISPQSMTAPVEQGSQTTPPVQ